jgi:uncharacterized protein
VYGGGGNSGAYYTHDFIELFNAGVTAVDISGWSVQYASTAGSTWQTTELNGTIQPGYYYLVQQAQGSGGTAPLPTPDAIGAIPMSSINGKVALVNNSTALSGTCPEDGIVDFIGYGTANCFEGSGAAPALTNTTAALRADGGCTDTDNNAADFAAGTPTPRNSSSPSHSCSGAPTVIETEPANGTTHVAADAVITIQFDEPVTVTAEWFALQCSRSSFVTGATSPAGPTTGYTITPAGAFPST